MKLSVSLLDEDVSFIDDYAARRGFESRSSVIHSAIDLLREADMESAYASAWDEWRSGEDAARWERTVADGMTDAAR